MSMEATSSDVHEIFKQFDINGDNSLSLKEFRDFLEAISVPKSLLKKRHVQALFDLINTDPDDDIAFDEFYAWWQYMAKTNFYDLEQKMSGISDLHFFFKKYDTDGSGKLERNEFMRMYNELGLHAVPVEQYFKILDANGDNGISLQEIAAIMGYTELAE